MRKIYWSLLAVFLLAGCATQKKKSDQSALSKFYHNTTAEFNGYFNAKEIVNATFEQLNAQHQENYNDILPIYEYRVAPNPEAVASNLDEAVKKVSIVATLHENSYWVDDCYLLIGKVEYLKQDFEAAENALEFFMDEFEPDGSRSGKSSSKKKSRKRVSSKKKKSNAKKARKERERRAKRAEKERRAYNKALRKKKKKSAKGKSTDDIKLPSTSSNRSNVASKRNTTRAVEGPQEEEKKEKDPAATKQNPPGIKHRPAYQEAELWLARTYIERDNYPRAEYHFNRLINNPYLQDEVKEQLPAAQAYFAISRKNYTGAIPHLKQAIEVTRDRLQKARYAFILGQIYDMEKEGSPESYEYFQMAYEFKPDYEMAFNAQLSMARTAYLAGNKSLDESMQTLNRMIRDEKNEEYLDKLYFTLARIDLFQGRKDDAIVHLIEARNAGGSNRPQQTETNYLLATLYYEKDMYIDAKIAYDAALSTMAESDERYEMTKILSENLKDIAMHLSTIELQDSLLRIAGMDSMEQIEFAAKLKEQKDQQASQVALNTGKGPSTSAIKGGTGKNARSSDMVGSVQLAGIRQARPVVNTGQSSFFAYDDRAIRRGQRDFERTWGDRPLVDNWRISERIQSANAFAAGEQPDLFLEDEIDEEELSSILKGVPSTPEEVAAAHNAIQNAKLKLGYLYRENLEDPALSVEILEELVKEYPEGESAMEAYYQLYLSHTALGNPDRANYYKEQIIRQFPGTKYALALSDPDYINKQLSEARQIEMHYENVYEQVQKGNYDTAHKMILDGKQEYGTNTPFQSKLAIMEAMCIGNKDGRDAYIQALQNVVANYPNTPEETKARDMLLLLGEYKNNKLNIQTSGSGGEEGPNFRSQPNAIHYMLVSIENFEDIDTKDAKISVSNYNRKYHKLDRLKISSLVFDPKTGKSIILVRSFKNSEEAMKYYNNIQKHPDEFLPEGAEFTVYPVSQFNYREIIKERSLDDYDAFFLSNY